MRPILFVLAISCLLIWGCKPGDKNTYITQSPEDWQPPVLRWITPPEAEVRGTVGVDVAITDSSSIAQAILYLDGVEDDTLFTPPWRFEIVTDSLLDGVHVCEARAWDEYGNLGISPILRINVMNSMAQEPRLIWVPDDFTLIQAAINAATDYDTIRVRDGTYYETLNLFGKGIWIESEHGPLRCEINAAGSGNTLYIPPSRELCTIRGFQLIGAAWILIGLDDGSNARISNNILWGDSSDGLLLTGYCGGWIHNNLFSGSRAGVQIAYFWGRFVNNVLQYVTDVALWNSAIYGNPIFHGYNVFWQNHENYAGFSQGIGEFDTDPLIDLINGGLFEGSPCTNTGDPEILDLDSTRSDIGPFGGPLGYH